MSEVDTNDPVVNEIVTARVALLFNQPFFGNLAIRLKLVDASKWCQTAATDGRHLYYNREFVKKLTREQLVFLIGHEVLHAVYDHIGRRGDREADLWNMANDYIVNYTLNETLVKKGVAEMPEGGLLSEKYTDEMTSEEVYKLLEQKSVKIQMPLDMHLNDLSQGKDKDKNNQGQGGGSGQTVTVNVMGEDGPPELTEADIEKIQNEMRAAVINAAQASGAGHVPLGIQRMIEALTEPKMDWRTLLEMHVQSAVKDDYTFQRASKKTWALAPLKEVNGKRCFGRPRMILPGQNFLDTIDIAIAIDASGSISDSMLRDFLSEVKGIMEMFPDFRLKVWTFDTRVYNYKEFDPSNLDEIYQYEIGGGGGTDFMCNWDFMKERDIEPERFVMFTDGYPCGEWGEEEYCDTLFIIHGDKSIVPPFGLYAYYEDEN